MGSEGTDYGTFEERVAVLRQRFEEGSLIRGDWERFNEDDDDCSSTGVCWLGALAPECVDSESTLSCPREVLPPHIAHLIPWLDDAGEGDGECPEWQRRTARFVSLMERATVFHTYGWEIVDQRLFAHFDALCREVFPEHKAVTLITGEYVPSAYGARGYTVATIQRALVTRQWWSFATQFGSCARVEEAQHREMSYYEERVITAALDAIEEALVVAEGGR